jgi:hypothetical protein
MEAHAVSDQAGDLPLQAVVAGINHVAGEEEVRRFAMYLARRDRAEGGRRFTVWGIQFEAWALTTKRVHGRCGEIDVSLMQAFRDKVTDTPALICPEHGIMVGPKFPQPLQESQ